MCYVNVQVYLFIAEVVLSKALESVLSSKVTRFDTACPQRKKLSEFSFFELIFLSVIYVHGSYQCLDMHNQA